MPKPEDTDLYQQRLPAWAPILTPRFATLSFASLGVPLLALGTMLLVQSAATTEHKKVRRWRREGCLSVYMDMFVRMWVCALTATTTTTTITTTTTTTTARRDADGGCASLLVSSLGGGRSHLTSTAPLPHCS